MVAPLIRDSSFHGTGMVRMAVGKDDASQILRSVPQLADITEDLRSVTGDAAVDKGQTLVFHQQIGVAPL